MILFRGSQSKASNLGIQEIVEVGVPLQLGDSDDQNASESKIQITETVSGTPLGSLKNAPPLVMPSSSNNLADQFAPRKNHPLPLKNHRGLQTLVWVFPPRWAYGPTKPTMCFGKKVPWLRVRVFLKRVQVWV